MLRGVTHVDDDIHMYGACIFLCTPGVPMQLLDRLDQALLAARQWPRRPRHRRELATQMEQSVESATIRLLRAIERAPKQAPTVSEIASYLGIDQSTASRSIDRAERRGEVARRACAEDRRRTRVSLTSAGVKTLAEVADARRSILAKVTSGWVQKDLDRLTTQLELLAEAFDRFEDDE